MHGRRFDFIRGSLVKRHRVEVALQNNLPGQEAHLLRLVGRAKPMQHRNMKVVQEGRMKMYVASAQMHQPSIEPITSEGVVHPPANGNTKLPVLLKRDNLCRVVRIVQPAVQGLAEDFPVPGLDFNIPVGDFPEKFMIFQEG